MKKLLVSLVIGLFLLGSVAFANDGNKRYDTTGLVIPYVGECRANANSDSCNVGEALHPVYANLAVFMDEDGDGIADYVYAWVNINVNPDTPVYEFRGIMTDSRGSMRPNDILAMIKSLCEQNNWDFEKVYKSKK